MVVLIDRYRRLGPSTQPPYFIEHIAQSKYHSRNAKFSVMVYIPSVSKLEGYQLGKYQSKPKLAYRYVSELTFQRVRKDFVKPILSPERMVEIEKSSHPLSHNFNS